MNKTLTMKILRKIGFYISEDGFIITKNLGANIACNLLSRNRIRVIIKLDNDFLYLYQSKNQFCGCFFLKHHFGGAFLIFYLHFGIRLLISRNLKNKNYLIKR